MVELKENLCWAINVFVGNDDAPFRDSIAAQRFEWVADKEMML